MLQRRLDAAIQAENYEEAAQIRDKIAQVVGK
jgi:protein-arginine kinase activator protein McsA